MKSTAILTATVALLSAPVHAFWRMDCQGSTLLGRLDPLVEPGKLSKHSHFFAGGTNVDSTVTYDSLRKSKGTSCQVREDKSLYWVPQLMFRFSNGTVVAVPADNFLIYYQLTAPKITAFPPGFRMLAGDPYLRSNETLNVPNSASWTTAQKEQFSRSSRSTGFNCIRYDGVKPEATALRQNLPTKQFIDSCTQIRTEQYFPSCWNGKDHDTTDHKSHMAYPFDVNGGACPSSHPTRTPTLLYETFWNVVAFKGQAGEYFLSNGDATGYGMHADFIMGWPKELLENAVKDCRSGENSQGGGDAKDCQHFKNLQTIEEQRQHKAEDNDAIRQAKAEKCAGPSTTICGDVKIQKGPAYAVVEPVIPPPKSSSPPAPVPVQPTSAKAPVISVPSKAPSVPAVVPPKASSSPSSTTRAVVPTPSVKPPAPTSAGIKKEPDQEGRIISTQTRTYTTTGGVIVLELVAIKEVISYTTVTVAAKQRRHLHHHMHHMHHRRDREHGLLGRS